MIYSIVFDASGKRPRDPYMSLIDLDYFLLSREIRWLKGIKLYDAKIQIWIIYDCVGLGCGYIERNADVIYSKESHV